MPDNYNLLSYRYINKGNFCYIVVYGIFKNK